MSWQGILKRKLSPDEVREYARLHAERRKKNIADKSKSWEEKRDAIRAHKIGTPLPEMQLLRWLRFDSLHPDVQGMLSRELTKLSEGLDAAPTEQKYIEIVDRMARLIQMTKHEWMNYGSDGVPDPHGQGSLKGFEMIKRKLTQFGFLPEGGKF